MRTATRYSRAASVAHTSSSIQAPGTVRKRRWKQTRPASAGTHNTKKNALLSTSPSVLRPQA